jgi:hypothetical protein
LRQSKTIPKEWITLNELSQFHRIVIWITQSNERGSSLKLLNARIVSLVKTNGFDFTFSYLKESVRLTVRALAGSPESASGQTPRVSVDPKGFPKIIPLLLRKSLYDPSNNVNLVRAIFCILSVYRTFKTHVKPSLESIIRPFDGVSETFSLITISKAVKKLGFRVSFGEFKGFISESAGPNSKFATWGSGIDALALLSHPYQLLQFVKIAWLTKSFKYLIWYFVTIIVTGPLYAFMRIFDIIEPLKLGKLSVVYDQAGKARIVAITNWWIQLALKPLHDSIFSFLKTLDTDGTFDQEAPLKALYARRDPKHKFSCFDLSSATDRLPITLQVDILNAVGVRGDLWRNILDFEWSYHAGSLKIPFGVIHQNSVKYSVGQPMGAYSSWGMLAVTHHVIVKLAAIRIGHSNFSNYAVLGDDIIIHNDRVAASYLQLMETLGVGINMQKSIVSYDMVEFAKRWITPYGDITPIGPGNILNTMRYPASIGTLIAEAHMKGYTPTVDTVLRLLNSIPGKFQGHTSLALWTLFGLNGKYNLRGQLDSKLLSWCTYGRSIDPNLLRYSLYNGLLQVLVEDARKNAKDILDQETLFLKNWIRISGVKYKALRVLELFGIVSSPGFWLYIRSIAKSYVNNEEHLLDLFKNRSGSLDDIIYLTTLSPNINPASIPWGKRDRRLETKEFGKFYQRFDSAMFQVYDEMTLIQGADGIDFY